MTKLLLPYAINSSGNFVHIDNARKGDIYICPSCGANLSLRISKIPKDRNIIDQITLLTKVLLIIIARNHSCINYSNNA